jgi:hypothetical protein
MPRFTDHPDNPSNYEAVNEHMAILKEAIADHRNGTFTQPCPWGPSTIEGVIEQEIEQIRSLLLREAGCPSETEEVY